MAYCEEAERLLEPVWQTVEELVEALLERRELMGHHVDRLVHGEEVLERPTSPI
jgi:ATP-dependent Zn protease